MKKSLLALAVLGAFAGAASAQSSVTLFGVIDVNGRFVNNDGNKQYQLSQDGLSSSRLGFRGTEDLGGGLAASFWIEGALNPDTGGTGQTWKRRITASLSGGWGEVRLGRDYTPTFWNATTFDPFGTNGVGNAGNLAVPSTLVQVPNGQAYGTLVRADNTIGYFLPSGIMGGLYGQLMVAAGENSDGNKFFGGRLGYASGPFNVAGSWGRTQVSTALDQDGTNWNLGGSWNFGFMTLSGFWGRIEVADVNQDNWFIGASAPIGLFTVRASYGQVDLSGGAFEGRSAKQFAIGGVYDLSKRTALYATWAGINNDDGANYQVAPLLKNGATVPLAANSDSQGLEIGIKHSF